MKTTLGQAYITKNEKGETVIIDQYNFSDAVDGTFNEYLKEVRDVGSSLYGQARLVGKYFGSSEGKGSPVVINLGKV